MMVLVRCCQLMWQVDADLIGCFVSGNDLLPGNATL